MSKRKADGTTVASVVVYTSEAKISCSKATTNSIPVSTTGGAVGHVAPEGISVVHVESDPTTFEEGGVHVGPGRAPVGPAESATVQVDDGGDTAASVFWELLRVAGYELW